MIGAWQLLALAIWIGTSGFAALHILLRRREPASSVLWLLIAILLPLTGPAAYFALGNDRVARRARVRLARKRSIRPRVQGALPALGPGSEADAFSGRLPGLGSVLEALGRFPAESGNTIGLLHDGDEAFPSMLAAIAGAQRSVLLQSYIFRTDDVGAAFLAALSDAARRGVRCHLLYDALGSFELEPLKLAEARAAGVAIEAFSPRDWLAGRFQVNLRNHRKLLVVDGSVGFLGGINVSDDHTTKDGAIATTDLHFRVEGPVVPQFAASFVEDWFFATGDALFDDVYFATPPLSGGDVARAVPAGPDEEHGIHRAILLSAIHEARRSVRVATPYFLPDDALRSALTLAALRGVDVAVLLPDRLDHPYAGWAMEAFFDELLAAGVRIARRPGPFLHAKLFVVDGLWAFVGSSNLDPRSLRLNFELNLSIAGETVQRVESVLRGWWWGAVALDLDARRGRSRFERAWANFWALWSPLL